MLTEYANYFQKGGAGALIEATAEEKMEIEDRISKEGLEAVVKLENGNEQMAVK